MIHEAVRIVLADFLELAAVHLVGLQARAHCLPPGRWP
jgi:hypothetical protein